MGTHWVWANRPLRKLVRRELEPTGDIGLSRWFNSFVLLSLLKFAVISFSEVTEAVNNLNSTDTHTIVIRDIYNIIFLSTTTSDMIH